jgi:hypothetical protein
MPDPARTAASTCRRIAAEAQPRRSRDPYFEDGELRAIIDLRDTLRWAEPDEFSALVEERPDPVGERRWDGFVAAVVEDEAGRKDMGAPAWVDEPQRSATQRGH